MPKKSMRAALGDSLRAEEQSVEERFRRADTILANENLTRNAKDRLAPPPARSARESESAASDGALRQTFTLTKSDFELLDALKRRLMRLEVDANKSGLVRASLHSLASLTDAELAEAYREAGEVPRGRRRSKPEVI